MTGRDDQLSLELHGEAAETASGSPAVSEPASDRGLRPEQRVVVDFETDLVVTAGAGSGKTRTLVALYRAILEDPARAGLSADEVGPARILCLTFTERAARELAGKVRGTTADERWLRELETWPPTTFHAWCADLLRRHPLEAGVDPRFIVMTEEAADELLRGAAVETLRAGLADGDEAARTAVEVMGLGRASGRLAEIVREIRTAGWDTRRPVERFEERLAEAEAGLGPAAAEVDRAGADLVEVTGAADLSTAGQLEMLEAYRNAFRAWRRERSIATAGHLAEVAREAGRYWRFTESKALREAVRRAVEHWTALFVEIEHRFQLGAWPALAISVRRRYRAARAARSALDFDDLVLRAREVLAGHGAIRDALRRRYRAVLVDEHQDTDPVQHELLRLLVGEDALAGEPDPGAPRWCVVGDAQQSIYGFRGATVAAFESLARGAGHRGARRTLTTNYRSRPELIAFHNAFFPAVLVAGERADQVGYLAQAAHRQPGVGRAVEVLDAGELPIAAAEAREAEARALAARLAAACDPSSPWTVRVGDEETGGERPARPGDVVVLFRRLTQVEPYRRALEAAGLESIVVGSGSFYGRQEVFDVLNALEAALHPNDPVPLVGFLRSPMAGLPDDAVWRVVRGWDRRGPPLREQIARAAADGAALDVHEAALLADALDVLAGLAARADAEPPGGVLGWLVDRTGYAAVLDALPDHVQRRANLERLLTLADRAPAEGHALLSSWTATLRRRVERPPRERDASLPEAGDRVRVMTVHQAKGLEFPVVALADIGGRGRGGLGGVAFDPELGIVAKVWPDLAAAPIPTVAYRTAKAAGGEREAAEEARLLYVACTRARDHLVLSAGASGSPWLDAVRAFVSRPESSAVVRPLDFDDWRGRYAAALGQPPPPLAEPGVPVLDRVATAPGEAAARELAAALAGAPTAPPPVPAAREAAAEALLKGARGHAALERLPLDPAADLAAWLSGPGGLPREEAEVLGPFATREIVPRLAGADPFAREHPFRLQLPGGGIVVGAIDALWRDGEGRWWVGDYKFAEPDPASDARHEAQLAVYALAAAVALALDRVGGILWYVEEGTARELAWTVADLAALERDLDGAFARLATEPAFDTEEPVPA